MELFTLDDYGLATQWYQIRLYSAGKIEIFQNVFSHEIIVGRGQAREVRLKYSSLRNTGSFTHSTRPMDGIYDIQVVDEPHYEYRSTFPTDKKIVIHGKYTEET